MTLLTLQGMFLKAYFNQFYVTLLTLQGMFLKAHFNQFHVTLLTLQGMFLNALFNQFHVPFAKVAGHVFAKSLLQIPCALCFIHCRTFLVTLLYMATPKQVLWQTVKTQMKCSTMLHFIRICTVSSGDPFNYTMGNPIFYQYVWENPSESGLQLRVCKENLIFLFLSQNICCGYSKESSQ